MEFPATGHEKWSIIQIVQFLFQNINYLVHNYNYPFTFLLAVYYHIHMQQWEFIKNFEHTYDIQNILICMMYLLGFFFFLKLENQHIWCLLRNPNMQSIISLILPLSKEVLPSHVAEINSVHSTEGKEAESTCHFKSLSSSYM